MKSFTEALRAVAGACDNEMPSSESGRNPQNSQPPPVEGWRDDELLMDFNGDPWLLRDACEGVIVFGGTGSGKTSGSGHSLAYSYLNAGFGGLVLCAKRDEPDTWKQYAEETQRSGDVLYFGRDPTLSFNFVDYEACRPGEGAGLTENIVNLFVEVAAIGDGEVVGGKGDDPFWNRSMKSLIRNCVELLLMAKRPLTLHAMFDVIRSAPGDASALRSPTWQGASACWACLQEADANTKGTPAAIDFIEVRGYWLQRFPALDPRPRGSIVEMFVTMAESLMRGKMRELFCSGTSLIPEHILAGKIVIVDLPVKEWGEIGRYAAVLWKYLLQKAIERRGDNTNKNGRPVFIWADECQYFISKHDQIYQTTARSSRASTVYLTQNYSNLIAAIGGEVNGRARVDSLLGNLNTKIFHANSDKETNQWAADLIGKRLHNRRNNNNNSGLNLGHDSALNIGASSGHSEQMDYEIQPREFTALRKGGRDNGLMVDAYLFQNGRIWTSTQRTWQRVYFKQFP